MESQPLLPQQSGSTYNTLDNRSTLPHVSFDLPTADKPVESFMVIAEQSIFFEHEYLINYTKHPHTLVWMQLSAYHSRVCNWCATQIETDYRTSRGTYRCFPCGYDVCQKCASDVATRQKQQDQGAQPNEGQDIALAFSGGGIRSASFCAGALKSFIEYYRRAPSIISSVSGGGYLASSFVHWQRAHAWSRSNVLDWYQSYFHNFEKHIGYFVRDWFDEMPWSMVYGFTDFVYLLSRLAAWFIS
jgi:hypothetical protein